MTEENPPADETPELLDGFEITKLDDPVWIKLPEDSGTGGSHVGIPMEFKDGRHAVLAMPPSAAASLQERLERFLEPQDDEGDEETLSAAEQHAWDCLTRPVLGDGLSDGLRGIGFALLAYTEALKAGEPTPVPSGGRTREESRRPRIAVNCLGDNIDELESDALNYAGPIFQNQKLHVIRDYLVSRTTEAEHKVSGYAFKAHIVVEVVE